MRSSNVILGTAAWQLPRCDDRSWPFFHRYFLHSTFPCAFGKGLAIVGSVRGKFQASISKFPGTGNNVPVLIENLIFRKNLLRKRVGKRASSGNCRQNRPLAPLLQEK